MSLPQKLWYNIKNIPGWSTKRRILVIESDDYGSIYMPSSIAYEKISAYDINVKQSNSCRLDNLETSADMECLLEFCNNTKDFQGQPLRYTPFFNPANADTEKLFDSSQSEYSYLDYEQTQLRYNHNFEVMRMWEEGIKSKIILPEYHGREHVNVPLLMRLLKEDTEFRKYVQEGFLFPKIDNKFGTETLRAAYFFANDREKDYLKESLVDGINLFKSLFNYTPTVFCPSNGVFHDDFKTLLSNAGVKATVESGVRKVPDGNGGSYTKRKFIFGKHEKQYHLLRYSRNVTFEPTRDGIDKSVSRAFAQMEFAFRWNKPVVVATHRVNFGGGFFEENRRVGLKALALLISKAQKRWPNLEFMSSSELTNLILEKKTN